MLVFDLAWKMSKDNSDLLWSVIKSCPIFVLSQFPGMPLLVWLTRKSMAALTGECSQFIGLAAMSKVFGLVRNM